ncbi:MAG: alkane 1-monooxygenase [Pseudomonadota bacterium]
MSLSANPPPAIARFSHAVPYWLSLGLVPLALMAILKGGLWIVSVPVAAWWLFIVLDSTTAPNLDNEDPNTASDQLFWYRLITLIWFPIQAALVLLALATVPGSEAFSALEKVFIFFGLGILSGTIGIVYAHELMHQKSRLERWLADLLMASVFYSHFRSEHLLVHHRYVGTPKDAVTARYNEGFHHYFARVVPACFTSALRAEAAMLRRKGATPWARQNPFWRYAALQLAWAGIALALGGGIGLLLLLVTAATAIWQLELVNYVEHYGLTREHLGDGKYENTKPRHSWNANERTSNWLLINLQRHSDHHFKPDRRFPLLQSYDADEAPQLPNGYALMTICALIPPLWFRIMNPRVRAWRRKFYPHITDWSAYKTATTPMPR